MNIESLNLARVTSCTAVELCTLVQVAHGILLGVGQIFACGALGPTLLILGAVLLYSPLLAAHALLGSAVGTLAGGCPSGSF